MKTEGIVFPSGQDPKQEVVAPFDMGYGVMYLGIYKRELYAMSAMQGLLGNLNYTTITPELAKSITKESSLLSDALIEALNNPAPCK